MPSKYYEVTACHHRRSIPSSRHLSWPSWPIVPVHGMVSAQPKSEIGWSPSCEGVNAEATVQTILQPLKNYALPPIPNYFNWLLQIPSTHFTHSYLRNLPSPTTWDLVLTVWHHQTNTVLLTVVILSLGCCMPIVFDFVTIISCFFLSCLQLRFVTCIINEDIYFCPLVNGTCFKPYLLCYCCCY